MLQVLILLIKMRFKKYIWKFIVYIEGLVVQLIHDFYLYDYMNWIAKDILCIYSNKCI